jgi:hypothetical protein
MVALSPVEAVTLHVVHCACQRVTLRVVLCISTAVVVYWLCLRLWGTIDPAETTLYNPRRLRETLSQFTLPPPSVTADAPGRHRTEALCRRMLEHMLEMELPKCRPAWLVNPTTKRRLELDMYNEAHKLAFEYDGAQHDVYTPHYHTNEHHFEYRRLLDKLKTELCRDAGITLIRIPWTSVAVRDPVQTACFLERLLYTHRLPYRSVRVVPHGPPVPSPPARRSPSP